MEIEQLQYFLYIYRMETRLTEDKHRIERVLLYSVNQDEVERGDKYS